MCLVVAVCTEEAVIVLVQEVVMEQESEPLTQVGISDAKEFISNKPLRE